MAAPGSRVNVDLWATVVRYRDWRYDVRSSKTNPIAAAIVSMNATARRMVVLLERLGRGTLRGSEPVASPDGESG